MSLDIQSLKIFHLGFWYTSEQIYLKSLIILIMNYNSKILNFRSSHRKVLLEKGVLKICSKFTEEHPYRSAISIKLQSNFIEMTIRHGCSPVNLLHISKTSFLKNTSRRLLLEFATKNKFKQETLHVLTIEMIYVMLTSLWPFQYFR